MEQKITVDLGSGKVQIDDKRYILILDEKKERPQKNPKQYTPKEVMKHLVEGGWVESRDYTNASSYYWLAGEGYFSRIEKRDDEWIHGEYRIRSPYDLCLHEYTLSQHAYFLIKPIEEWTIGRCGEDVE